MQNTGNTAKNEKLDNPMSKGNGDVGALNLDNFGKQAAETVTSFKDGISNFTAQAQEKVTDVAHKAQEYGEKAVGETRTFVRNNPGQALLIGFGAGLILGYAVARK